MYGRAEFDLLKLRVLHQSNKSQDEQHKYKHKQGLQADQPSPRRGYPFRQYLARKLDTIVEDRVSA